MIKDRENALAGARCIIQNWLEAKESEVIHFITDESHKKEADIFELAAFECGVVPKISILSLDGVQSGEVIDKMKNTMYYSDVIVGATHYSFVTTEAVEFALKKGSRFLSFPMHTNDGSCIFEREFIRMSPKLAKKMGKTRLIAETGAGQHGVATATAAALMGMECEIFMGKEDTDRQALNVYRMRLLGAKVNAVTDGTATLKDAVSACMREWTNRVEDTHYVLGSVMGPHPFPVIVRDFQAIISKEIKEQILEAEHRLPDVVLACVGGGSNAIGTFYHFIEDKDVKLIGCEAAGRGIDTFETAATINTGRLGIFHGMKSYFCQDDNGGIAPVYSISAGLDYPGIGPEHAYLHDIDRAQYVGVTDDEAVEAFEYLSRIEGIIPAIESAHAVAHAMKIAPKMDKDQIMVITISGRGDKDCAAIARYRGENINE